VADLGLAVNKMAADLERSKALDRQFLMSVSHDLRTPLTAISGYAEALRDGATTDAAGAGEVIGNHAARLEHLVGDLLDLARLDANRFRLDIQPFDLSVVAGRVVAGLANQASQRGIRLAMASGSTAPPVRVVGDPNRTTQAITNIVENALKFAEGTVDVEVLLDRTAQDQSDRNEPDRDGQDRPVMASVSVTDDGPGFAEEDLPYVFDRLYVGKAKPRAEESSTGLGLAIVGELAAAMGGRVTAGNGPGGGASLRFELPVVPVSEQAQTPRPPTQPLRSTPSDEPVPRFPVSDNPTRSFPDEVSGPQT
jgi:two-component system sensor histidine kinase BaeS